MTLKYAKNAFAAGTPTRTSLGELTTLPQTLQSAPPLSAPAAPPLSRRNRAFGARQPDPHWFFDKSNTASRAYTGIYKSFFIFIFSLFTDEVTCNRQLAMENST